MKRYLAAFFALAVLLPLTFSCQSGKSIDPSAEFAAYVKAYTGGTITSSSTVRVEFSSDFRPSATQSGSADTQRGVSGSRSSQSGLRHDDERLFSFSPSLKGTTRWISPSVLEFTPDEGELVPGKSYKASLDLAAVADVKKNELKKFDFSFRVAPKSLSLDKTGLKISPDDPSNVTLSALLSFSEAVDAESVASMIKVDGASVSGISPVSASAYRITLSDVRRGTSAKSVTVRVDASQAGYEPAASVSYSIPAEGVFQVLDATLVEGKDPYVDLLFSEPLDKDMEEKGFFTLQNVGRFHSDVEDNKARIYFDGMSGDAIVLNVSSMLRSYDGTRLGQDWSTTLKGSDVKPEVRLAFQGNILPDEASLVIPFYAVGLRSVTVRVVKIYEDNILMFLQDNDFAGSSDLRRSGRLVCRQTIRLDDDPEADLTKSKLYTVDLSELFRKEPGAIYRVRFTFTLDQTIYASEQGVSDALVEFGADGLTAEDDLIWDTAYPYYYESFYDWNSYDYKDRENPAAPSYYMDSSRFPACNLISSNIGLIVKSVDGGRLWVSVNDIMTAEPMPGVELTAYNYQLQPVGKAKSDSEGFAEIKTSGKPFALVAEKGKSSGYLKLLDGLEKSLSRFDTGGEAISSGLKAFVYGERGVWRPGDTLHISIMIDDRDRHIPESHPVTMEIYNPQGQFYARQVNTHGVKGLYVFDIPTREDDPTGVWNAYFKVGGASFHKALHIETVKANRMKVILKSTDEALVSGRATCFELTANWLTGPAASGLSAVSELVLSRSHTSIKGYEGYIFDNPLSEFSDSRYVMFEKKLNAKGQTLEYLMMPEVDGAPGMLKAAITTRVMEAGGESSIVTYTMPFVPYSSFVGVQLPSEQQYTDCDQIYKVAVVDADGRAVAGHELEYRIYKLDWSWWWQSGGSYLDSYVNGKSATPVSQGSFISGQTPYNLSFRVDYPEWGRYLVYVKDLTGGHSSGGIVYLDWPSWRGRSDKQDPSALTMLSFNTDKKSAEAGEEVTVYIPAAEGGRALVSLENGRRVISRAWVKTSAEGDTQYKFRLSSEMAPNVYIHVTLLQEQKRVSNDLPIRLYGVQTVMVNDRNSHLEPVISLPEVLRPQEKFTVKVKEKNGKPMCYTLAIVDEGLLDLTSFRTPDPWNAMYAREALGVKTWDLYDDVIGAFSGKFSPMFSIGGDEDVKIGNKKDSRFNPVVKFLGPFSLERGEAKHELSLPMYVGSVRVMVVAGQAGAYGNDEKTVPVRTPLMVLPTLPRVLGTEEQVTLPANIFAMEDDIRNVSVKVSVDGPLSIKGSDTRQLSFSEAGDQLARFSLSTGSEEGTARVTVTAVSGPYKASDSIVIEVRNPNQNTLVSESRLVKGTENFSFAPFSGGEATVQVTGFPAVDFDGFFSFVSAYEYDCTEQLASKGMTLLYIRKFLSEEKQKKADVLIPEILRQLYSRQLPDGGFAFWPGAAIAQDWTSSMAGHFLSEAAASGYSVNKGVLASWKKFQKKAAAAYRHSDKYASYDLNQAYRLYTMAISGAADEGAMNRLKSAPEFTVQARWRLAAAYAVTGKKSVAEQILADLTSSELSAEASAHSFGSEERDKAMMLETAVLLDKIPVAMQLAEQVSESFRDGYHDTQSTAFSALAMNRLSSRIGDASIDVEVNGEKIKTAKSSVSMNVDASGGSAVIKNNSSDAVYATLLLSRPAPYGQKVDAESNVIRLSVRYTDLNGKEIDPARLTQGQDFMAQYLVTSPVAVNGLALRALVPSGCEIFNDRLFGSASAESCTYKDIRDDRVVWYFDISAGGRKKFKIRLQAAYEGEFVLPSVKCEAMYDPMVHARTASGKMSISQ